MISDTGRGLVAAAVATVAFGSFAVPIQCRAARRVPVDPLVLQTYKVGVCLVTTVAMVMLGLVSSSSSSSSSSSTQFSCYGIISGLLMVPGGTAGYYGVRHAGLATAQGLWSALKVLVAFAWGCFIFHEPVQSITGTVVAIVGLLSGLVGMSYFASRGRRGGEDEETGPGDEAENEHSSVSAAQEPLLPIDNAQHQQQEHHHQQQYSLFGWSSHTMGLLGAILDGLYGGSVLVPMHFAPLSGLDFLWSFAAGCALVLVFVWLLRWMVAVTQTRSFPKAWRTLPSLHFNRIGGYALLAGLIWSIGNVTSILSVAWLGQGLGYSLVQSQLIVAGLWAILYYGEIKGRANVGGWSAFCALTMVSILLLTRQHEQLPMDTEEKESTAERLTT